MYVPILMIEAVRGVIFGPFSNVDNFRPEVHGDVISGSVVDPTGDSRLNRSRDIRLPHFVMNDDDADRWTL